MADRIPHELVEDIFSRLPVKTLIRFKCISRTWRSTISTSEFIKKHLNRSSSSSQTLLLAGKFDFEPSTGYSLHLYSTDYDSFIKRDSSMFVHLNLPLRLRNGIVFEFLGSCNGLFCLFFSGTTKETGVILLNPSTRKHRNLPVGEVAAMSDAPWKEKVQTVYGFGYDSVSSDHKVVRIVQMETYDGDKVYSKVEVYSLELDSWKMVENFRYYLPVGSSNGVLSNGALHWIVKASRESDKNSIVAFDLRTEKYSILPHSKYFDISTMDLGDLDGCLVCYNHSLTSVDFTSWDIWVMKEYGVEESWMNLCSIQRSDVYLNYPVTPITYSRCGRQLLLKQGDMLLFWYDLESKSVKCLAKNHHHWDWHGFYYLGIFTESLVEPSGILEMEKKRNAKEEVKNKEITKKRLSQRRARYLCGGNVFTEILCSMYWGSRKTEED